MKHTTRTAIAAVAIGILLGGCLVPSADDGDAYSPDGSAEPTQPSVAASPRTPRPSQSGQSLEGRFTYQTMDDYVDAVMPLITNWIDATWKNMPSPRQVLYVPRGAQGPESCLDADGRLAQYSTESYEYCGADETIYVGQDMLWAFYSRTGDAGPAVGLAHEFGHFIQDQVGVPDPQTTAQSVRHENQADCIAGAWTLYTDETGNLEREDDLQDIDALFPLIGSAEGADRDHGTARERLDAFSAGFARGLTACNAFYPSAPLISS